ncbi:restriction endonuclease subunit S [Erythrobacter donghaensis]|uniref:restriction endonuclease subunit S n=1 Tax=Erythrobacter donghaensis TaxID=267135 RepID=UPI000A37683F|nr:restriction endonuclease subunit S [Erythrobacter donghaensis]
MAGDAPAELYAPAFNFGAEPQPLLGLAEWINGLAFKNIAFTDDGLPVVKIAEIKGGFSDATKRTNGIYDDRVRLRDGDLLFCWSGQPETSIGTFVWDRGDAWLNQHIFRVLPDQSIDRRFFRFLMLYLQPNFQEIARNKQTTGLGHVTKGDLGMMMVQLPSLSEQERIANTLQAIQDKIELNNQMAETLQHMARALFKSWFVAFDPVHAKAEGRDTGLPADTAALFPSSFGDDGLPKGWRISTVGELFSIVAGNTPSTKQAEYWDGPYAWATPKDMSGLSGPLLTKTDRSLSEHGFQICSSGRIPEMSLLMSSRAPVGYLAFNAMPVSINQGIAAFVEKALSPFYAWAWCHENMNIIKANANGSTFQEISKGVLRSVAMIQPSTSVHDAFVDIMKTSFSHLLHLAEETEALKRRHLCS